MSAFNELAGVAVFRPFDGPPPAEGGIHSPFSAGWGQTVSLLVDELRHLDAKNVVIEVGLRDGDLRIDGMPRANARMTSDAVRIAFGSKWGPLMYETGEFSGSYYRGQEGWQANIRAIALGMEALRKVDRYGVSKRGEQYRGWRQLAASTDPAASIATAEQAQALIDSHGGLVAAIKATHPDHGGNPDEFRKVMRAKELLS